MRGVTNTARRVPAGREMACNNYRTGTTTRSSATLGSSQVPEGVRLPSQVSASFSANRESLKRYRSGGTSPSSMVSGRGGRRAISPEYSSSDDHSQDVLLKRFRIHPFFMSSTRPFSTTTTAGSDPASSSGAKAARETIPKGTDGRYLHLAPGGDAFIGDQMFAAKHLSTDYLRSIKITDDPDADSDFEETVEAWCATAKMSVLQEIYDSGELPAGESHPNPFPTKE